MTERSPQLQTLNTQLAQEVDLLRQLYTSLQHEHQCLAEKALDKLTAAVEAKQTLLGEFDSAVSSRMDTLSTLGLDPRHEPQATTLKLIQDCAKELPEIMQHWLELEGLLEQCKEQNEINGAIIEVSSHSLQTAYALLTASTSGETDLYNAKGISRKGGGTGNTLAKA